MRLSRDELKSLMKNKLMAAGLHEDDADTTAEILTWSDERGYHSHGSVRVEYYSERIAKGGITVDPKMTWKQTGPCSGMLDGDNGIGYVVAKRGMAHAIELAKENGVAIVGMRRLSHSGSIGYYTEMAAPNPITARTRFLSRCRQPMGASLSSIWPRQSRPGARSSINAPAANRSRIRGPLTKRAFR